MSQSDVSTYPKIDINTFLNHMDAKDIDPVAMRIALKENISPQAKIVQKEKKQNDQIISKVQFISGIGIFKNKKWLVY